MLMLRTPSRLWHCWFGISKSIRPIKNWVMEYWHGYLSGVWANDLHMVQLMPLPPIISCFSKIQNGLPFWCRLTQVVLEKKAIKRMCMVRTPKSSNEWFVKCGLRSWQVMKNGC